MSSSAPSPFCPLPFRKDLQTPSAAWSILTDTLGSKRMSVFEPQPKGSFQHFRVCFSFLALQISCCSAQKKKPHKTTWQSTPVRLTGSGRLLTGQSCRGTFGYSRCSVYLTVSMCLSVQVQMQPQWQAPDSCHGDGKVRNVVALQSQKGCREV